MKLLAKRIDCKLYMDGTPEVILHLTSRAGIGQISELQEAANKGKSLDVEIKIHREKRSLDSNAYFWQLIGELAEKLNLSRSELYLHFLKEYGKVFDYLLVVPEAVDRLTEEFRTVVEIGKGKIGEREAVQLQVFYGSSSYTSAEMSRLIKGVVYECELQGIQTKTPEEIADMLSLWEAAKK